MQASCLHFVMKGSGKGEDLPHMKYVLSKKNHIRSFPILRSAAMPISASGSGTFTAVLKYQKIRSGNL